MLRSLREKTDKKLIDACKIATAFVGGAMVIDFIKLMFECI